MFLSKGAAVQGRLTTSTSESPPLLWSIGYQDNAKPRQASSQGRNKKTTELFTLSILTFKLLKKSPSGERRREPVDGLRFSRQTSAGVSPQTGPCSEASGRREVTTATDRIIPITVPIITIIVIPHHLGPCDPVSPRHTLGPSITSPFTGSVPEVAAHQLL